MLKVILKFSKSSQAHFIRHILTFSKLSCVHCEYLHVDMQVYMYAHRHTNKQIFAVKDKKHTLYFETIFFRKQSVMNNVEIKRLILIK